MNRNLYRLVQNTLGQWVAVPEVASGKHKGSGLARKALLAAIVPILGLASAGLSGFANAAGELPVPTITPTISQPNIATTGQATVAIGANVEHIYQATNKATIPFNSFNISAGNTVEIGRVTNLTDKTYIPNATFDTLAQIGGTAPSVIAGAIHAAAGQNLNLMLINTNGIVFANGAQVDVNSFFAGSLNIKDQFINNLAPVNNVDTAGNPIAQFEGNKGFVKVLEGARITASSGGSVILFAPTVTNRGTIETSGSGQTVLAAGNRVYLIANEKASDSSTYDNNLRGFLVEVDNTLDDGVYDAANTYVPNQVTLDGKTIQVGDAYDKLGNATNLGSITAQHGNITMVGLAVNQMGRATATSTLSQNGSIYLYAKDTASNPNQTTDKKTDIQIASKRSGRLTVGSDSVTQVVPDLSDSSTFLQSQIDSGTALHSAVRMVGKTIDIQSNAVVRSTAGNIDAYAVNDPTSLSIFNIRANDPFAAETSTQENTSIYIGKNALFDVSGITYNKSVADNYLEFTLRSDELKDSPVNRTTLYGTKVWVDLLKGSPLVSSAADYKSNMSVKIGENSTKAGSVSLNSTGQVVVDKGAQFNLAGGKVVYADAVQETTMLLGTDQKLYSMENAKADTKYISTGVSVDSSGNKTTLYTVNDKNTVTGYTVGKDAGNLKLNAKTAYFAGKVDGSTTTGENQVLAGTAPVGASLTINNRVTTSSYTTMDGVLQDVQIGSTPDALTEGFKVTDSLSGSQNTTLKLDAALFGGSGVNNLSVNSVKSISVNSAINLAPKGSVKLSAHDVNVNNNIVSQGGSISLNAKDNPNLISDESTVNIADNVLLSTAGGWYNDTLGGPPSSTSKAINGSSISIDAQKGEIKLGQGSIFNVKGGGYVGAGSKITAGNGGNVALSAWKIAVDDLLQAHLKGEAIGTGGTLSVTAANVKITDQLQSNSASTSDSAQSTLWLNSNFFQQGFSNYNLTGKSGLEVVAGTQLNVRSTNVLLDSEAIAASTGTGIEGFSSIVTLPDRARATASVSLTSGALVDNQNKVTYGVTKVGEGAVINVDPTASIKLTSSKAVEVDGKLVAKAGKVSLALNTDDLTPAETVNSPTRVHLGHKAVLDVSGTTQIYSDGLNLQKGSVLDGGTVDITSSTYVSTEAGSLIDVHGQSPVYVDTANSDGSLGKLVGSSAGKVNISVGSGAYLDNAFNASPGAAGLMGGTLNLGFTTLASGQTIHVGEYSNLAPQTIQTDAQKKQIYADLTDLVGAGFDNIKLTSGDKLKFEGNISAGLDRTVNSMQFVASTFQSDGGDAKIGANIVKLSKADSGGTAASPPVLGTGNLSVKANLIELTGSTSFSGFNTTDADGAGLTFNSSGEFRLTGGKSTSTLEQVGSLDTLADIDIKAAVVFPSTLAKYTITTAGDVNFTANGTATDPMSALGKLIVNANNINQFGNIVAPFGSITLKATNNLVLGSGSTTSVAANDKAVLTLGKTSNGTTYYVDVGGTSVAIDSNTLASLSAKTIKLDGKTVNVQSGSKVDISGGGDLQAWEFTAGTGGSADILAKSGYYALVPIYQGVAAPSDAQEASDANIGQRVYISGGNGIPAGFYTLMPAHYALLSGAYAIKLTDGIKDTLPNSYSIKQDGTTVVSGFLTDSRNTQNTSLNILWTGYEVLTRDQVMARSGYTLTKASDFFANTTGSSSPKDAGLLQITTQTALTLAGTLGTAAVGNGKGAAVDISANKLAIVDGTASASGEVALDVTALNKLKASSLLLGGLRTINADGSTTLNVGADTVRMDTSAANPLTGNEVILTATNTVSLQNNSSIVATGAAGDIKTYNVAGNHALLRAGASDAIVKLTGTVDGTNGTILAGANTSIVSSNSLIFDATKDTQLNGAIAFAKDGRAVAGNLTIKSSTINLGDAISVAATGLNLNQQKLDGFGALNSLNLTSYSSFNTYGNVSLGGVSSNGQYTLGSLTLDGVGLSGRGDANSVVSLNASNIKLTNTSSKGSNFAANATGAGVLNLNSDTLNLAAGDKQIAGFQQTNVKSTEVVAQGSGTLTVKGNSDVATNRFSGLAGASQSVEVDGQLSAHQLNANALVATTAMGADWKLKATTLNFDTALESHGGNAKLIADTGNVTLGSNANIDVSGKAVKFFDVTSVAPAGNINITATKGNIQALSGSKVNVSSDEGGDAGKLSLSATQGNVDVVSATLLGTNAADSAGNQGAGASFVVDANSISNFNTLNQKLNTGGFSELRDVRLRSGDLKLTQSGTGTIKANIVSIAVDQGSLNVDNEINASGAKGGSISLAAKNDVTLTNSTNLHANATKVGEKGGSVTITTTNGNLSLQAGKIDVANSAGEASGEVLLRTPRSDTSVAVKAFNTLIRGAQSLVLEGVKTYQNITNLTANTTAGSSLGVDQIQADNDLFMGNKSNIVNALGSVASGSNFHLRGGAEVRSSGNLTVDEDIDFYQENRVGDEPGTLTLLAAGNLNINGSISDGFSDPTHLAKNDSWNYRLVSGADLGAANVMATNNNGTGNFTLAEGKTIRTGTGDINIATGGNFNLNAQTSTIYTAGKAAEELAGFNGLNNPLDGSTPLDSAGNDASPQFGGGGGSITLNINGNINGAKSNQLYTDWLWRVGKVDANGNFGVSDDGTLYLQTAWWVNYASFNQGIATFGGGDIHVNAGGTIQDLNLSTVTNGRMASSTPDAAKLVVKGGGDIAVAAGGDIKGGEYYVEEGNLSLNTLGSIGSSPITVNGKTKDYFTLVALGNATAELYARQDVKIQTVLNPMTIAQSTGVKQAIGDLFNSNGLFNDPPDATTYFSTYGKESSVSLTSLSGDVDVYNRLKANQSIDSVAGVGDVFSLGDSLLGAVSFAGTLNATAYQGNVNVRGESIQLAPQTNGQLSLLANGSINLQTGIAMSDQEITSIATPYTTPATTSGGIAVLTSPTDHASTPLHINDTEPARIYAVNGDIVQTNVGASTNGLILAKKTSMVAGRDIINANIVAQNINSDDVTYIKAGRDITQSSSGGKNEITLNGPGLLEIEAGRNIDLGGSYGIVTQGNLLNSALAQEGATVHITTGVPNGVDYTAALERLIVTLQSAVMTGQAISESTLWQARWLLSEDRNDYAILGSTKDAQTLLAAVSAVRAMSNAAIESRVRHMYYLALQDTGVDHNDPNSPNYGKYTRGFDTIALLFPNINEKNADGSSKNYAGTLSLVKSRIKTLDGGDIEFMVPGGEVLVGLTEVGDILKNTSSALNTLGGSSALGIVAVGSGSVRGFSQDSIIVNQSRILTTGNKGEDSGILLWSNEGDIDAGKGKKTAVSIPPPVTKVVNGVVTVTQSAAANGSGIGALGDPPPANNKHPKIGAGSVDLIAPFGTVNAGDAGIRAGNINIAAAVVLGADNISASGSSSGVPVSDTGALSGALAGASGVGGDATKQVADQIAQNSKQASDENLKKKPSASLISVEVVKIGD